MEKYEEYSCRIRALEIAAQGYSKDINQLLENAKKIEEFLLGNHQRKDDDAKPR